MPNEYDRFQVSSPIRYMPLVGEEDLMLVDGYRLVEIILCSSDGVRGADGVIRVAEAIDWTTKGVLRWGLDLIPDCIVTVYFVLEGWPESLRPDQVQSLG
jgi:hypothetical protein